VVLRAAMPEAPIYEHRDLGSWKYEVSGAANPGNPDAHRPARHPDHDLPFAPRASSACPGMPSSRPAQIHEILTIQTFQQITGRQGLQSHRGEKASTLT
jgi:hypothetical protein